MNTMTDVLMLKRRRFPYPDKNVFLVTINALNGNTTNVAPKINTSVLRLICRPKATCVDCRDYPLCIRVVNSGSGSRNSSFGTQHVS